MTWKVLPHGPIEALSENVWRVKGSIPGMSLERVMTVVRLADGGLVLHSPIALAEPALKQLEAWGSPRYLLVPSGGHRLDAPAYKTRFPDLKVLAPAGCRAKVAEKVPVDGTYEDLAANDAVRLETLEGTKQREGVMIVTSSDGVSIVFNDLVMNMDKRKDFIGWAFTTMFGSAPGPRISRLAKWTIVDDKAATGAHLDRLVKTPNLTRLIVSHDKVATGPDAAAALAQARSFL